MKLEAKILLSLKEDEWNNLLYNSPTSTAYQTSNWIKSYKTIPDSKPLFIQIETASGKIVGQLASIIHKNYLRNENVVAKNIGWKFNISSILTWSYGPVIYDLDNYPEILSLIISKVVQIAKENNVVMIRGSTAPLDQNNSRKLFEENGFNFQPWSTYVISLNETITNLYSTLDKKTKYDIRKSEKNNLSFEIPEGPTYLKEFYELKNEEYKRDGRNISPISNTYQERWNNLFQNGLEKVFLTKHNGKILSGISNIIFNGYLIQHAVANSSDKSLLGGTFLTWETIKWAIKNNQKFYDVGGINPSPQSKKEKNIDFFKSKWGGTKFTYGIFTKVLYKKKQILSSILKNPKGVLKKLN